MRFELWFDMCEVGKGEEGGREAPLSHVVCAAASRGGVTKAAAEKRGWRGGRRLFLPPGSLPPFHSAVAGGRKGGRKGGGDRQGSTGEGMDEGGRGGRNKKRARHRKSHFPPSLLCGYVVVDCGGMPLNVTRERDEEGSIFSLCGLL